MAGDRLRGSETSGFGSTRIHLWNAAVEMIRDYPISGIGLDQFLYHHTPRYIDPAAWPERYSSHPHNIVLDTWLSLGVPGLLLLAAALTAMALRARSIRRDERALPAFKAAAIAALTAGLAHGMIDNAYFLPDLAVLTWILIALVAVDPGVSGTSNARRSDNPAAVASPDYL